MSCLHDNGGCEHYCEEATGRRECSCADGYFLGTNGQNCISQGATRAADVNARGEELLYVSVCVSLSVMSLDYRI